MQGRNHTIRLRTSAIVWTIFGVACGARGANFSGVYSFGGGTADGANPYGNLTLSGSALYGMTSGGGGNGGGTIFSFTPIRTRKACRIPSAALPLTASYRKARCFCPAQFSTA
jgi:uncharacterized repeat protein (TIGR03803 family)